MENGGGKCGLWAILPIVKEEWSHDLILCHEDRPFTSDGMVLNQEIDDVVIGDGVFLDEITRHQRKAKGDAEHDAAVIVETPWEVEIRIRIRTMRLFEVVTNWDARKRIGEIPAK